MIRTRTWLFLFAALAFAASVASLYVHYRLITDTSYTSFCDVSETVSCEAVYESEYGTVRGVPLAAGGAIWAGLVLLLAWRGMRDPRSDTAAHVAEYVFVLSVLGLAAVLYLGYASVFVLDTICVVCVATYVGVFGVFFVAAGATTMPFRTLPVRLLNDLRGLAQRVPPPSRKPPKLLDTRQQAAIVAIVCGPPPPGYARWTIRVTTEEAKRRGIVADVGRETVRQVLADHELKPWRKKMWRVPELDADYIECKEDVLNVLARPYDAREPVVGFDERPVALRGASRPGRPMRAGRIAREDYEYVRRGTANIYCIVEPKAGRH